MINTLETSMNKTGVCTHAHLHTHVLETLQYKRFTKKLLLERQSINTTHKTGQASIISSDDKSTEKSYI